MKITFKKTLHKLHLWLGLASGLVVFIIAITGCIYAFEAEIQNLTQPYKFVQAQDKAFLPPSILRNIADKSLPDKHAHAVMYKSNKDAAQVIYFSLEEDYYYTVYLNPYTGQLQQVRDMNTGFFHWILEGHFYLWLPHEIGQPVVATATLIFTFMVLSGLYLWWKRKKGSSGQKFKIKWDAKWRRVNYDMHNVLGFYVMIIALIFALTGLVWGFEWFAKSYYKVASGGEDLVEYYEPVSDTTKIIQHAIPVEDQIWQKMVKDYPTAEAIEVHVAESKASSIGANANPDASTYWKADYKYFDQYTLKEIPVKHIYNNFQQANTADKLLRMNYDIHTGAVWGFAGKLLAFFASLVVASLPVTGAFIWWGRKKKERKPKSSKKEKSACCSGINNNRQIVQAL